MSQFIFYVFFLIVANVLLNNYFLYKDYLFSDCSSLNNTIINNNLRTECYNDNNINNNNDNNINNDNNNNINNNIDNSIIRYYLRQI
jgi:hypothetical protein